MKLLSKKIRAVTAKTIIRSFSFGLSALILSLTTSCSSDDLLSGPSNPETPTADLVYLNLAIGLDRADDFQGRSYGTDPGDYETGTSEEYSIVNGNVYLFMDIDGTEENALMVASGELGGKFVTGQPNGSQISTSLTYTNIPITGPGFQYNPAQVYYELVVLNANEDFIPPSNLQKFSDWATQPQSSDMLIPLPEKDERGYQLYYITMTNATGLTPEESTGLLRPTTLVKVDNNDITLGEVPSPGSPSTTVYVQRNVAKVLVQGNFQGETDEDKVIQIGEIRQRINYANFFIEVMNQTSFPVMNLTDLDGLWTKSHTHSGYQGFDRVFWAVDPNYDNPDLTRNAFKMRSIQGNAVLPLYCLENTFNQNCMLQGQTTRVVVKGRWFICDPRCYQPNETYYDEFIAKNYDFRFGVYRFGKANKVWDQDHLASELKTKAASSLGVDESALNIVMSNSIEGGYRSLSEIATITSSGSELSSVDMDKIALSMGLKNSSSDFSIAFYKDGFCYFPVRIRHFDDSATSWNSESRKQRPDGKLVASYDSSHLGRYGVVRNNYYLILIDSFLGLGSPTFPDFDDFDTDDEIAPAEIAVSISVKGWGKHSQIVDMQ